MQTLQTNDRTNIHVHDVGDGPPVVFLHGWTVGSELWKHQLAALPAAGMRCVAYDRRGCGRAGKPTGGYDYDTLADDLHQVIEQLALDGVTVVAHSMAVGEVARLLTRHGSDRVANVVLVAPTTPVLLPAETLDTMVQAMESDLRAYLEAGAAAFFGRTATPDELAWGVDLAARASLEASVELTRTFASTDLHADLATITVPTVVVHGDADESAPIDMTGRPTADAIPGARLVVVPGAPHGLPLTHPAELNAVVSDIVTSRPTKASA